MIFKRSLTITKLA